MPVNNGRRLNWQSLAIAVVCCAALDGWFFGAQADAQTRPVAAQYRVTDNRTPSPVRVDAKDAAKKNASAKSKRAWVNPVEVVDKLKELKNIRVTEIWATETHQLINFLLIEDDIRSYRSRRLLTQLEERVDELDQIVAIIVERFPGLPASKTLTSTLGRLKYDLEKRLAIWSALQAIDSKTIKLRSPFALASAGRVNFDQFDPGWKEYLRLAEYERQSRSLNPDLVLQRKAARQTLVRLYSPILDSEQNQFLHQMLSPEVLGQLKDAASDPVDHYQMMRAMERYERKPSGLAAHYVNEQFQNLLWSDDDESYEAAQKIQTHYRNANIRLTVSRRMLNRLIPESPTVAQPVNERVLGAEVNGHSQIHNALSVKLVPDPDRLHLELQTNGRVDSDTVARQSGFAVRNSGRAKFHAFKRFAIDRFGNLDGQQSVAHAQARQRLVDIESSLDPFPVVNWIARRVAQRKVSQQAPKARMLLEEKVEGSAIEQLELGVGEKIATMQSYLKTNLLDPLIAMDLDPEILQTATTSQRLVMRYRLAGLDQMAAHSPRPRDSEHDYMGVQMHQSLLNNMIERIEIQSQSFTPETLLSHLSDVIGFNPDRAGADVKKDATFEFANYDPIRVDLGNGGVRIELNLKSLRVGKGKTWRNITIASTYTPEIQGSQIRLVQHSPITVKGRRFRLGDQIAVRAIFTVLFPSEYTVPTVPARLQNNMNGYSLAIEKLEIADGWAAVTFDEIPLVNAGPPAVFQQSALPAPSPY